MRASRKLKPAHAIVLHGLEIANLAHHRAVKVVEIIEVLSPDEIKQLKSTYKFALPTAIASVLHLLSAPVRGLVFSPGKRGQFRYFASAKVLDRDKTPLPEIFALRYRTLQVIRAAVMKLGRAVRVHDIVTYAAENSETAGITQTRAEMDIQHLLEYGELIVAGAIRGCAQGRHLYLPSDMDVSVYAVTPPLSWLDEVADAFNEEWEEHVREALIEDRHPHPVTTKEIRARLKTRLHLRSKLQDSGAVTTSLHQLTQSSTPLIRKVGNRRRKFMLWAPADVSDKELEVEFHASDSERVGEAVGRAVKRLNRPVILKEIIEEIKSDPLLKLQGFGSPVKVLVGTTSYFSESREKKGGRLYGGYVQSLGTVNNKAYYYPYDEDAASARAYVTLRQVETYWKALRAAEHLDELEGCILTSVAKGRAMLIISNATELVDRIEHLINENLLVKMWRTEAEGFCDLINSYIHRAQSWLSSCITCKSNLPASVDSTIPTVTKEELVGLLKPLYPVAQKISRAYEITRAVGCRIRRFKMSKAIVGDKYPKNTLSCLYDRTDALLYAAKHWGGYECCVQAGMAASELGYLRDPYFVLPNLHAKDFNVRLMAVACLAFLWSKEGTMQLRRIAVEDDEPGVRQAALWAYGFAGGEEAKSLAQQRTKEDSSNRVQAFAQVVSIAPDWWHV